MLIKLKLLKAWSWEDKEHKPGVELEMDKSFADLLINTGVAELVGEVEPEDKGTKKVDEDVKTKASDEPRFTKAELEAVVKTAVVEANKSTR